MVTRSFWILSCLLVCAMVVGPGCRKTGKTAGDAYMDDETTLDPYMDGGEFSMGASRFELGIPVDDVSFQAVSFGYDSYQLGDAELAKIDAVFEYMRQNGDVRLITEGHCDERGSRDYNLALGENRAQAVRAYLINLGLSGDRVQTRSHGEESPLEHGHSESAWAANRRVEFSLFR